MILNDLSNFKQFNFKNIIFDWGGVIIDINYQATITAFNKLSNKNFEEYYSQSNQIKLFSDLETGNIKTQEFYDELRNEFGYNITNTEINDAWCAMLLDIPVPRIELLLMLGKKYRIFLLSNTNIIHENVVIDRLNSQLRFNFYSMFEKVYLSHHIGMRKPNAEIFEFVIMDSNLKKSDTLFIDDSKQNISGASEIGLPSCFLASGMDIVKLFDDMM